MHILSTIVVNIIIPVFLLIGTGALLHRKFNLDINTMSKLTFYYLIPAVIFVKIYQSEISLPLIAGILTFLIAQFFALLLIAKLAGKLLQFDREMDATFTNSVILNNSGNFGLPVNDLVFRHDPFAMSVQIIVMTFQNFLTFTVGLFNVSSAKIGRRKTFSQFMKMPSLYALLLGLLCNAGQVPVPDFIWVPLEQAANGLIALALVTLGAQSAYLKLGADALPLFMSTALRLVISPLIALGIIFLLKIDGITAQALLIASSFPTSRNSAILALEYNNKPEFAAQTVLVSTLCSSLTVTGAVYLAQLLF